MNTMIFRQMCPPTCIQIEKDGMLLTVFDVRMYIFVLPNAYSLADIGRSRSRHVTPSTDPSPLQ